MDRDRANAILVKIGWVCFVGPIVLWPISMFTFAKDEPVTVLGLSWLAVILSGATILLQTVTKADIDSDD